MSRRHATRSSGVSRRWQRAAFAVRSWCWALMGPMCPRALRVPGGAVPAKAAIGPSERCGGAPGVPGKGFTFFFLLGVGGGVVLLVGRVGKRGTKARALLQRRGRRPDP